MKRARSPRDAPAEPAPTGRQHQRGGGHGAAARSVEELLKDKALGLGLSSKKMKAYVATLRKQGYTDADKLAGAQVEDMERYGVLGIHARRIYDLLHPVAAAERPAKIEPEEEAVPVHHRNRFVTFIAGDGVWGRELDAVKKGYNHRLGGAKILHIFGESGAGKSYTATIETKLAVEQVLGPGSCCVWIEMKLDRSVALESMPKNHAKRDEKALAWGMAKVEQIINATTERVIVWVLDEYQTNIPMCRGLAAKFSDLFNSPE